MYWCVTSETGTKGCMTIPILIICLLCQKHIIKGVAAGAVKG